MHLVRKLIEIALEEDIGSGDITAENLVDASLLGSGNIIAKEALIIAGLDVAHQVFSSLDPDIAYKRKYADGDALEAGEVIVEIEGRLRFMLMAERIALNFLQRLSGIATCVRQYADELQNGRVRLTDTRKTSPGWRVLEKYAVRVGGGHNHRMGLYDGVLIKDNHIAACGGIAEAVAQIRDRVSHLEKVEIEVSDLAAVNEALEAGVDVIMLDNMDMDGIREAVALIDGRTLVEVSGRVTRGDLKPLADAGVDIISVGALTHSARAVDMSMRIDPVSARPGAGLSIVE